MRAKHDFGCQRKFGAAFRGLSHAARTESSFWIHIPITVAVISVAFWLGVESWRWVALTISIMVVIGAELLNSSIEELVRVVHPGHDQRIGNSLDMAAAGVLVTAIGAVIVGLATLGPPLISVVMGQ